MVLGAFDGRFWGVCGLLHGGTGQETVVFLMIWVALELGFALWVYLEGIWGAF